MRKGRKTPYGILKVLCDMFKYSSGGNLWYENPEESNYYKIFHYTMFTLYYLMFLLECMEVVFYGYPKDLHNDAVSFVLGHVAVIIRVRIVIHYKKEARQLASDMVTACQECEEDDDEIERTQYKKILLSTIFQLISVFSTMVGFTIEGIRRMRADGMPFVPIVTYYPSYDDHSNLALASRITIFIIHYYFLWNMVSCDSLAIGYLILISMKFTTLRNYYTSLANAYDSKRKLMSKEDLRQWFKLKCIEGQRMHLELKRLACVITKIFGIVISIQVCESTLVTIQVMMRLALTANLTFTMVIMNLLYTICLLFVLALNTWNCGELTFQASLIDTAIFHSGWDQYDIEYPNHKDVRHLVLMTCVQAQNPIVIKAFGLHIISYETFVGVLKTTYSIFAILRR